MIRINLLPRAPRRRLPGRRIVELGLPALTLAVVIVLWVVLSAQTRGLEQQVADVNRQIAEVQPVVARVLELDRQIAVARNKERVILDLLRQQLPAASILNEVRLLVPRDVWLTAMSVPEASALNLEGQALNYHAVAQFMDNLGTGQLFRLVDLTVVQVDRVGTAETVRFSITARIARPQAAGGVQR